MMCLKYRRQTAKSNYLVFDAKFYLFGGILFSLTTFGIRDVHLCKPHMIGNKGV